MILYNNAKNLELKVATYIIEYLHFILYIIILVIIIIIVVVIILRNTDKQQINSKIMSDKERRYLQQKSQKVELVTECGNCKTIIS